MWNNKKHITGLIGTILFISMIFFVFPPIARFAYAGCSLGIDGNGTNGITININAAPYTTFQNYAYGGNAYTSTGCGWFASARAKELTGKGNTIWNGNGWWNEGKGQLGFTCGSELRAKSLACYRGHILVVEAVDSNNVTISEGGSGFTDSNHGYCRIRTMTRSQFANYRNDLRGYVYLTTAQPSDGDIWFSNCYTDCISETMAGAKYTINNPKYFKFETGKATLEDLETGEIIKEYTIEDGGGDGVYPSEECIYFWPLKDCHQYQWRVQLKFGGKWFDSKYHTFKTAKDNVSPTLSDLKVENATSSGFDISCKASDNLSVRNVLYCVKADTETFWQNYWVEQPNSNDRWYTHVNISDHSNIYGTYSITAYANDESGNSNEPRRTTVTIGKQKAAITKQPLDGNGRIGETVCFSLTAEGAASYQWYFSQDNGKTWSRSTFSGNTTNKLSVPIAQKRIGQKYYCAVTGKDGSVIKSNIVTIVAKLVITKQPVDASGSIGETVRFSVSAEGAKSYQWYFSQDNGKTWSKSSFSGNTTNKLSVPVAKKRIGQKYYCVVIGSDGTSIKSNEVTIKSKLVITKQPIDVSGSVGETVSFSVSAEGAKSYQWYFSQDNGKTWSKSSFSGNATNKLSVPVANKRYGQQYKCIVAGNEGNTLSSNIVKIVKK